MIDMAKKYKTRDGRDVRIYATDGHVTDERVHGSIASVGGADIHWWDADGKSGLDGDEADLIEVKPEHTLWWNIYRDSATCIAYAYATKELADKGASASSRVACVKITFREGDGL